jgi:hypothetical protein
VTNFFLTHASWFAVLSGGLGFSTDLEDMIKSPLIFWGYGHTVRFSLSLSLSLLSLSFFLEEEDG